MSQPTYLKALKEYVRRLHESADPEIVVEIILGESDRGAVILMATGVEDVLEWAIIGRLPNLLNDETARDAMFGPNGGIGTFSLKIAMAYAMGIIDKAARREIDLIREMRNACAHARLEMSFKEPVLRDVCKQVISEILPHLSEPDDPKQLRHLFVLKCVFINQYIIQGKRGDFVGELIEAEADKWGVPPPSLGKPRPPPSPEGR